MKTRLTLTLGASVLAAGAFLVWDRPAEEQHRETVPPTPMAEQAASLPPGPGAAEAHDHSAADPADCTIITHYLPNGDGTVSEVYSCEQNAYQVQHPYHGYSDETLVSLAYSEAKAAEIMSMRLREMDEEAAMSLAFRAVALSGGDTRPLVLYSNAYPQPGAIDDMPIKETYRDKYVLSAVALMLGDSNTGMATWERRIREFSEDPEQELALLDERARQIFESMRQIQLDVTGKTTFGG